MTKHSKPKPPARRRLAGWSATAGYVAQEVAKALLGQKHDAQVVERFDCFMLSSVMQFAISNHIDANTVLSSLNAFMFSAYTTHRYRASRIQSAALAALGDQRLAHKFVRNKFVRAAFDLYFAYETKVRTPIPKVLYETSFPRPRLMVERGFDSLGARVYVLVDQKSVQ